MIFKIEKQRKINGYRDLRPGSILSSPAFLKIAETLENTTRRRSLWCQKILHHTSKV
jgi:hypothetical protein